MNPDLATGPLAEAVGWALLHLLWQGALVAAALAILLWLLERRSANLRYALSCAALLLIVALGVTTGIRSYSPAALATVEGTAPAATGIATASSTVKAASLPAVPAWSEGLHAARRAANDALPLLVTLWLLGVSLSSVRLALEWLGARRLVARSVVPAAEPWQAAARRLATALGVRRAVRLLESTAVVVPSVIGFVRPAILLPASTLAGLTPLQLEMILAHELAHIRRHDFLVNLLQSVVETLLFYHPAVWWISRRVREERENCCDDLAVAVCGSPLQYARALARLEELRAPGLVLAASANGGSLLERVRRLAGGRPADRPGTPVAALSALLCVFVALATITLPAVGDLVPAVARKQPKAATGVTAVHEPTPAPRATHVGVTAMLGVPAASETDASPAPEAVVASVEEAADGNDVNDVTDVNDIDDVTDVDDTTDAGDATDPRVARERDGRPTLDELIALKVHNVTPERIQEIRALFPGASLEDITGMSAVGATPEYVRTMRAQGLEVRDPDDATSLAALGVTPEYLRDVRSAGLTVREAEEAQGLKAVGVTARFVREMRSAGIAVRNAEDAQGLAAVGVTAEFVRGMRETGLRVTTADEAQSLRAVGVTPEYVRGLRKAGVEITSAEEAQGLRALGVTPRFVEKLADAGYTNLSVEDLQRLGASGVTGDFVRQMSKYRK